MQGFYMALLGADKPDDDRNRLLNRKTGQWIGDSPGIRNTLNLYKTVYQDLGMPKDLNYAADIGAAVREALANDQIGILASGSWEDACLWDCNGVNLPSREERDALVGWTPWPGNRRAGQQGHHQHFGWLDHRREFEGHRQGPGLQARRPPSSTSATSRTGPSRTIAWPSAPTSRTRPNIPLTPISPKATALAADTTGRDTIPGYQTVSALVQQMTTDILDGASVEDTVQSYHDALVDEFGEDKVITYE